MCSICNSTPCLRGCPNRMPSSEEIFDTCIACEESILEGQQYINTEKGYMHWECFLELGIYEQVDLLGGSIYTA